MGSQQLGDKGLAIFCFAAYHQLNSGKTVAEVVIKDGAGHAADPQGVREIEALGLAQIDGDRAVFSEKGVAFLATFVQAIQGTAKFTHQETATA